MASASVVEKSADSVTIEVKLAGVYEPHGRYQTQRALLQITSDAEEGNLGLTGFTGSGYERVLSLKPGEDTIRIEVKP